MLDFYHIPLEVHNQQECVVYYKDNKNGTVTPISEDQFFDALDSVEHLLDYTEFYEQNRHTLLYADEMLSPDLSMARCFTPWPSFDVII